MTDAALADSGPAPDAPAGAPINENAPSPSSPLGSQIPEQARAENQPKPEPKSISDSIDRAFAKSAAKEAEKAAKPEAKVEAKPEPKAEPKELPTRGEGGKFAAKDAPAAPKPAEPVKPSHTAEDAPARFTDTAKAKWAAADPEIRGETLRMQKELTDGFQKYKAAAERDGALNEFHEMAKASGKELHGVVREYVNMEQLLRSNPEAGLERILDRIGLTPRQYAEHILNKTPDQQASQQDATIRELRAELAAIRQEVGGVTKTIEQQRQDATLTEIGKFASDHHRFEELADDIAFFMRPTFDAQGNQMPPRAKDLPEAYAMAERLNPAPAAAPEPPAASSAAPPEPPVQPDKGSKSINGAPSSGSSPSGKKRVALSIDESLSRAFGRAG